METLRVLVVDDELGMRRGTARVLERQSVELADLGVAVDFSVDAAADGAEAVARLRAGGIDLLLLDYKLPDISGLDILETIRREKIDVLTVMITAYASLEVAVSATKNGAFDFLAKPFTPEELRSVVEKSARSVLAHRQAQKLAAEKRQVRFQFISVVAHELKAPLAVIESFLTMMDDRTLGDEMADYADVIHRALVRVEGMRKMIVDLLDLTHIESGQKKREIEALDVAAIAGDCLENAAPGARERGIALQLTAPGPVPLAGDRGELEIILNNLITNAVKYNRDGGRVDVAVERSDGAVSISVADTGIGMNEAERGRLFQEFTRIKNAKTRHIQGSGLGLSILKKLALLYGGDVAVESEPDEGSTFRVSLRDAGPDAVPPAVAAAANRGDRGS